MLGQSDSRELLRYVRRIADSLDDGRRRFGRRVRKPVAATTVKDEMGTRDLAVVVCDDGTVWNIGPTGDCILWATIPDSESDSPPREHE